MRGSYSFAAPVDCITDDLLMPLPFLPPSFGGQLKQVMDTLMKQYKQREEELVAFQKEHGAS